MKYKPEQNKDIKKNHLAAKSYFCVMPYFSMRIIGEYDGISRGKAVRILGANPRMGETPSQIYQQAKRFFSQT